MRSYWTGSMTAARCSSRTRASTAGWRCGSRSRESAAPRRTSGAPGSACSSPRGARPCHHPRPRAFIESDRSDSMIDVARRGPRSSALLVAAWLAVACRHDADRRSIVERGRYLVDTVALCNDCHTPRNADGSFDKTNRYLAGVECLIDVDPEPGKGCLNSRNLTSDATGLKSRTDVQIKAMFQDGV